MNQGGTRAGAGRLAGKVALVTGAESGIGAATARLYAAEGAGVVGLGLQREKLEAVAREIGGVAIPGDATKADEVRRAVTAARERFGGLDILAACAGLGRSAALLDQVEEAWVEELNVNLGAPVVSCRECIPALIERGGGSIVLIASVAAVNAGPQMASYSAAKTAILGLTRSLAVDYGRYGIRVNAVCPGLTRTPMADVFVGAYAEQKGLTMAEAYLAMCTHVPLPRAAEPEEIAAVCLFLASGDSSCVTGTAIVADCGQTAVNQGLIPLILEQTPIEGA